MNTVKFFVVSVDNKKNVYLNLHTERPSKEEYDKYKRSEVEFPAGGVTFEFEEGDAQALIDYFTEAIS